MRRYGCDCYRPGNRILCYHRPFVSYSPLSTLPSTLHLPSARVRRVSGERAPNETRGRWTKAERRDPAHLITFQPVPRLFPRSFSSFTHLTQFLVTVFHLLRLVRVKWSGQRNRRRTTRNGERRWQGCGLDYEAVSPVLSALLSLRSRSATPSVPLHGPCGAKSIERNRRNRERNPRDTNRKIIIFNNVKWMGFLNIEKIKENNKNKKIITKNPIQKIVNNNKRLER